MPDVTRSDSQRSDASLRPRVSFNRDVHVKRIVPREGGRVLGALSGDGDGHLVTSPVRKERLSRSKEQLAKEAAEVLEQADKLDCVIKDSGVHPNKFYTLPTRKKRPPAEYSQSSLDRRTRRRNSDESAELPPKKPPRTFAARGRESKTPPRTSVFSIFKKSEGAEPRKSSLRRSVSDASNSRSKPEDAQQFRKRSGSETEDPSNVRGGGGGGKKQLSPIIEVTQREDYFAPNDKRKAKPNEHVVNEEEASENTRELSVTEKLKEYIDEIDNELYKESGAKVKPPNAERKPPEIVIIDVDEADQISSGKKSKGLGKKLKSLTKSKSSNSKTKDNYVKGQGAEISEQPEIVKPSPKNTKAKMIHSSQKPADKLPLTRGRAVDNMVKRLSHDSSASPPPKTNIMITPNVTVQHNNNQPFSYTRGHSPEKTFPDEPRGPVIYAQVVCGGKNNNNSPSSKQTVHTTYINGKKNVPHSDSDEGLGYEENSGGFGHRKYEGEKTVTHFGDEHYEKNVIISYNDHDRFEEEFPITPKFKTTTYNGFGSYEESFTSRKTEGEQTMFIDSSNRGRGDGMDAAKRRESLTEPDQGLFSKYNGNSSNVNVNNGRSDLSARRDLLESRMARKLGEKTLRPSPEYSAPQSRNVYVTTETSRYYRSGSASPVAFRDKYVEEVVVDKVGGDKYKTRKYFGYNRNNNNNNNVDSEPKSFDSQISDYRSSPEATSHNYRSSHQDKYVSKTVRQQIHKDRDLYKSNPEINLNQKNHKYEEHQHGRYPESYHDSLKRVASSKYRDEQYFEQTDSERKDKFGDSGIENDFRRDSGENFKREKREAFNESEDEGFASSLLIASERQHTEDNFATRKRSSNRSNQRDDGYNRHVETAAEVVKYRKDRNEYAPRERSIDDGSHFDPRIDKEVERATLKKGMDKKPPKPEKKSGLEKMKQLFSRDSKKKKEKERNMVREESLRARYTEYRGSREELGPKAKKKDVGELNSTFDYGNRRRLSTPSPSPPREPPPQNEKPENTHGSWFKSLDRLARKKSKKDEKEFEEESAAPPKQPPQKSLRFFGDTDIESNDSLRKPSLKIRPTLAGRERTRSQSTRDLHNISEERASPETHRTNHKSMLNISEASDRDLKGSRLSLKPPMSPNHRHREASRSRDDRNRRRKNEVSSVESSTEGDSSQQSQRSVVYLHAATVGDIPGPGHLRGGRRAASREELTSNGSSRVQPQTKTLSRSFSVLAPWRPKHYRETMDIDYTQYPKPVKNGKYEQKASKNGPSRKENSSTLKKKAQETKRINQSASTLNRKSRSKENVSTLKRAAKEETPKSASSTLYKKKERQPKENTRYNNSGKEAEKKFSAKTLSMESLGGNSRTSRRSREEIREVSRSISMPRDPEKSAGWFKMKKSNKKTDSAQRL